MTKHTVRFVLYGPGTKGACFSSLKDMENKGPRRPYAQLRICTSSTLLFNLCITHLLLEVVFDMHNLHIIVGTLAEVVSLVIMTQQAVSGVDGDLINA